MIPSFSFLSFVALENDKTVRGFIRTNRNYKPRIRTEARSY